MSQNIEFFSADRRLGGAKNFNRTPWQSIGQIFWVWAFSMLPLWLYFTVTENLYDDLGFWVYFDHVESLYYWAGREIIDGLVPSNLDNPGAPVQWLSAFIFLFVGTTPEKYGEFLACAGYFLMILHSLSMALYVRFFVDRIGALMTIASIWFFFITPTAVERMTVLGPEALYFIVVVILSCVVCKASMKGKLSFSSVVFIGAVIGFAVSIKFLFLSYLAAGAISIFLIQGDASLKSRLILVAGFLIGVFLSFFTITFYMLDGYPRMFGFLAKLMLRDGPYGTGDLSGVSLSKFLENLSIIVYSAKAWTLIYMALLTFSITVVLKGKLILHRFILLFFLFGTMFILLMLSRQVALRYTLVMGGLATLALVAIADSYRDFFRRVEVGGAVLLVIGLLLAKAMLLDLNVHASRVNSAKTLRKSVAETIFAADNSKENSVVIYGWRYPTPSFSLRHMARRETYQKEIDRIYPQEGHFTPWPKPYLFRVPSEKKEWDFAVLRKKYIAMLNLEVEWVIEDTIGDFVIIKSTGRE